MSVRTIIEPLASITHGGDVIEYLLDAEGLNYGSLVDPTAGIRTDQGSNDWYEVHLVDKSDRGIIRYIEVGASGDSSAFSDVKRHLKRYGSPMDELFTVISYRETDTGPLTSPLTEDLTFLQIDNQLSSEDVEVTFDLSYFTVKRYGVEPAYLDYLDDLTVASGQGRSSLEEDIMDVFSIREITRSFYRDFGKIFRDDLQGAIHGLVDPDENLNTYTRVVVNRVLFLLFVEEKGWLDGDIDYVENRYEQVAGDDGLHIYDDFFQPLFFEALSQEGTTESQLLGRVPFLNGGLFERMEIETDVRIEAAFFEKLLSPKQGDDGEPEGFLRRYKISLRESNPSEQELVVDPEFIGRIFEMFMQEGERSEVGAFYTPKPITAYMTKNALKQHLLGKTDISHEEAVSLVSDHTVPDSLTDDQIDDVNRALRSATVLDPAVGSGAFIIAMLEELVAISEALDYSTGDDRSRFQLKEEFIADTLYGVDIDAGGIELCKFRVWLHLMQDLDVGHDEFLGSNDAFALPNLGFKFFVGNSLVGEHDPTNVDAQQSTLAGGLNQTIEKIHTVRTKYQSSHGDKKEHLAEHLDRLTAELEMQLAVEQGDWMTSVAEVAGESFSWTTNIPEVILEGGFDMVVGNPPYEGQSKQDYVGELARFYDANYDFYKTIPGMRHDLYQKFIIRGWELTREGGILSYITSNTFYTIGSKETTRRLLQDNILIDLTQANPDTFDAAVNPAIFAVRKSSEKQNYNFSYIDATDAKIEGYRAFIDNSAKHDKKELANRDTILADLNIKASARRYQVPVNVYRNSLRRAFFKPTDRNLMLYHPLISDASRIYDDWGAIISDSDTLDKNRELIRNKHLNFLEPGDISILGLLTVGGQGLATGSNDDHLAYLDGSYEAEKVKDRNDDFEFVSQNSNRYKWMSRVIRPHNIADFSSLTRKQKELGIDESDSRCWLPIVKGKGNSFYKPITEFIDWSKPSVDNIRRNGIVRNERYYFNEGIFISRGGTGNPVIRYSPPAIVDSSGGIYIPTFSQVSAKYLNGLLNSDLIQHIINEFINGTVNTQIQDMRLVPVVIPTDKQLSSMEHLVEEAIAIRMREQVVPSLIENLDNGTNSSRNLECVQSDINNLVSEIYGI